MIVTISTLKGSVAKTKMTKALLILSVLTFVATTSLYAQKAFKDSLDFKLTQAFNKTKVPGFTAIIINKNGIAYQKSLGYANSKEHIPFTTQTIENIGSVSKTFIAVALMKAIELGYFSIETNINEILPFKVINPYFQDYPITIKQLTTHTSGIIDNDSIYHKSYKFIITMVRKEINRVLRERGIKKAVISYAINNTHCPAQGARPCGHNNTKSYSVNQASAQVLCLAP